MEKILIVVDIQNDFVDGALGTKEACQMISNAAEKIKNFEGQIFVTFDTHFDNYMETSEGKNLPVPHCIKGTKGWKLNSLIQDALEGKKYIPIEKVTFGSKELPQIVKETVGEEFEACLIGLCTDICVVSNALLLKANFPENKICVDASCCAGVSVETHQAALKTMECCQIEVIR
ncbi:MAG: cysteine hydrolase [Clostridia bacterium]|nr:cysteine hydrolase [Clostridia bacterium]